MFKKQNSNWEEDIPIIHSENDFLGRKTFSHRLAKRIFSLEAENSVVIGISGKWGVGKTSIINMAIEKIEDSYIDSPDVPDEEKPIIIRFNPWNVTDQNQLISLFFKELIIKLEKTDYEKLKTISEKIELYINFIEPGCIVFPPLLAFTRAIKKYYNAVRNYSEYKLNDLEGMKEDIRESLLSQDHKIIVTIEDIDRLNNKEIWQIFQLIKLLANFPKIIYLIEFDRDIVAKAIDNLNFGSSKVVSGYEYLEKIVTIIFEVPSISVSEIENLIRKKIKIITDGLSKEEMDRFGLLYQNFLKYVFLNIRDVKRFFNTFCFIYEDVKKDVNPVDFFVITTFQVFFPQIYDLIKENKYLFAYTSSDIEHNLKTDEELQDKINKLIGDLDLKKVPDYDEKLLKVFKSLFPRLDDIYQKTNYPPYYHARWDLEKRISIESHFDVYFRFSVPSWELSQEEFDKIMNSKDLDEFVTSFLSFDNEKKQKILTRFYMDLVHTKKYTFDERMIKLLIKSFILIGDILDYDPSNFNELDPALRIYYVCAELIYLLHDIDKGFCILKNAFMSSNSLYTMHYILTSIYANFDKTKDQYDDKINEIEIDSNQFKELEGILSNRIETVLESTKLNKIRGAISILFYWKDIDPKKFAIFARNFELKRTLELVKLYTIYDKHSNKIIQYKRAVENLNDLFDLKMLEKQLNLLKNQDMVEQEIETINNLLMSIKRFKNP